MDPVSDTRDKQSLFVHFAAVVDTISRAAEDHGFVLSSRFVQHLDHDEEEPDAATLPDGCVVALGDNANSWEDRAAFGWYSKSANCIHSFKVGLRACRLICAHLVRRLPNGFNKALLMA